jgi:hypothetical protein
MIMSVVKSSLPGSWTVDSGAAPPSVHDDSNYSDMLPITHRFSRRHTSRSADHIASSAHTLLSTSPRGNAAALMAFGHHVSFEGAVGHRSIVTATHPRSVEMARPVLNRVGQGPAQPPVGEALTDPSLERDHNEVGRAQPAYPRR